MSEVIEYLNDLPKGWALLKFNECCDNIPLNGIKVKQKEYKNFGKFPVIDQGRDLVGGYFDDDELLIPSEPPYIVFGDHTKVKKYVTFNFIAGADGVKVLKPFEFINSKLLYYFIHAIKIPDRGYARHFQFLAIANFPIPPVNEQKRILDKIEELITDLDKGIEYLETAQQQLKVYRQSVLKWAFEGKLTTEWRKINSIADAKKILDEIIKDREQYFKIIKKKPKPLKVFTNEELENIPSEPFGWKWLKIDSVSEFAPHSIKAGPFGSSLKKESYVSDGYKIYGQEQVIAGDAFLGDYFIDSSKYNGLISCKIKPYDILISLVGTIGKVLILPENCKEGIINPRLVKISLNRKFYEPKFFKYYFESAFLRTLYKHEAHGATMDVLNLGMIQELPFPLCSIKEQHKVISEIESRLSVCDKIEETIETSLLQAEALRLSIIKKAFEGKLVPQNPSDEPAGKLLERIKAAKGKVKAELEKGVKVKPAKEKTQLA